MYGLYDATAFVGHYNKIKWYQTALNDFLGLTSKLWLYYWASMNTMAAFVSQ